MVLFLLGLVLFVGLHLAQAVAPGAREAAVAALGRPVYRILHSVLSVATLCLLIYGFGQARLETGILYTPPAFLSHITLTLMLIAMIVLASSFLPAGYIAAKTKHPMVTSVKIWAFAHLLANGETVQVILFAVFLAWAVVVRISYKKRMARGEALPRPYKSWTYDVGAVVIGLAVYGAIVMKLHMLLIGVPVMAMG
ncbi:putative membrane protein [Rhizobium sp. SG_E_25_P2]|uniref:NnrU family protein n=1 Tax=Rhizobium sp. SG_E_25_P2 TaxID=2879942 RepID=UPI0024749DE8|nr:NnrU family protein [Rhizobium sp. SG_E_25_P2]MDH6267103.1 putative membrane protein [Rhizobium sp. SG_E_25_P2]